MANVQIKLPNGNNAYPTEEIVDFSSHIIKNQDFANGIEIISAHKSGRVCFLSLRLRPAEGNIPVATWISNFFTIDDNKFRPVGDVPCASSQGNTGKIHLGISAFLYFAGGCSLQLPNTDYATGNYAIISFTYISKA